MVCDNSLWRLAIKDMDLIEVLWKQDVDMGFSLEEFQEAASATLETSELKPSKLPPLELSKKLDDNEEDPWAGLSYTIDLETGEYILKEEVDPGELGEDEPPSALLGQSDFSLEEALQLVGLDEDSLEVPELAAAAQKAGAAEGEKGAAVAVAASAAEEKEKKQEGAERCSSPLTEASLEDELDLLADMIQAPNYHHHHHHHHGPPPPPRPYQGRMAYMRSVSSDQRWQELAGLLSLPAEHYHYHPPPPPPPAAYHHPTHHPPPPPDKIPHHAHHHGGLPPEPAYLGPGPGAMGGNNLGSAVASSMNLMTNSSEPMAGEPSNVGFKMENPHDMMYYQNGTGEMGHNNNTDGFLSSILNDEDLQLMDMAMNEGMYTMRMLEGTDSDSAVSSMGSERVPSLTSDTDWMETNSDSGHTPADHFMTDCHSKYRWYDYGYSRQHSGESASSSGHRMPPVAQKKHHLYGKRMFQEQQNNAGNLSPALNQNTNSPCSVANSSPVKFELRGAGAEAGAGGGANGPPPTLAPPPLDMVKGHQAEIKYSCSIEFTRQNLAGPRSTPAEAVVHNHTYHMPPEQNGVLQRPLTRDKKIKRDVEEGGGASGGTSVSGHLSRDERRARALNIPMAVDDIINLPMDEFNERLSKFDLSESQLSLIRDIRRRGKNKVAAQNCRKRKLDQILCLADEVKQMREKKQRLIQERDHLMSERLRVQSKFKQLYKHIFQSLRDSEGNPYSPYDWSLQQSADGTVVLVPRGGNVTLLDQP